jgi:hypothetical protein
MAKKDIATIPKETIIAGKIVTIRDEKVILDVHLAEFYEIETRVLKQAVKRNRDRFPGDFMFELTVRNGSIGITKCDTFQKTFWRRSSFCFY